MQTEQNIYMKFNVRKIIFASCQSVYGTSKETIITENHPQTPFNAYARSKQLIEKTIDLYVLN